MVLELGCAEHGDDRRERHVDGSDRDSLACLATQRRAAHCTRKEPQGAGGQQSKIADAQNDMNDMMKKLNNMMGKAGKAGSAS